MSQLMPGTNFNLSQNQSRRSPILRSEINSIKFDFGDDDNEVNTHEYTSLNKF